MAHELGAVADAKYGQSAAETRKVNLKGLGVIDGEWTSAENDTDDRWVVMRKLVVGEDFAESVEFAHTTSDELRRLRAEIEDDDFLLHRGSIYINR